MVEEKQKFIGYEYRDVAIKKDISAIVIDGYENFGWQVDSSTTPMQPTNSVTIKFKRDRAIRNKAELTRLQRQFDADLEEIQKLESSKTTTAATVAFLVGIIGTAFMAGAIFAIDAEKIMLMIALAVPGFVGWVLPYFIFNKLRYQKTKAITPLIDQKYDEIYAITKQGNSLLEK